MSDHGESIVIERVIQELRRLPPVPADTAARVARSAMAAGADEPSPNRQGPRANRGRQAAPYIAIAVAAGVVGFLLRGIAAADRHRAAAAPSAAHAVAPAATAVSNGSDTDGRPVEREFEYHSRTAQRVSLVGDFNDWDPTATPLVRAGRNGIWAVTVPVAPGRHMYAFVIDDTSFVLDPTAPAQRDTDLGTTASVIVVGRP